MLLWPAALLWSSTACAPTSAFQGEKDERTDLAALVRRLDHEDPSVRDAARTALK